MTSPKAKNAAKGCIVIDCRNIIGVIKCILDAYMVRRADSSTAASRDLPG